MKSSRPTVVGLAVAVLVLAPTAAATAGGSGEDSPVRTVASGLDGPRQLSEYRGHRLLVAESDSGEVSSVDPRSGEVRTLLDGLAYPQGVDSRGGLLYVAVGEAPPPDEPPGPFPVPEDAATASLLIARPGGPVLRTIDLEAYELANNPDGQVQFVDGVPVDALSNPFSVLAQRKRVLVADAGANDVLAVDPRTGQVSTFFVPPLVTSEEVPACGEGENSPGTVGCDPVPTGIVEGPDGLLYVSTLGALVPGAGRVYVLTQQGQVVRVIEHLDRPTGIEVGRHGEVYVSDVFFGAPEGEPGPDFDPSAVGRVLRIDPDGTQTVAAVTMPSGLVLDHDRLFVAAWSVASVVGLPPGSGEVVQLSPAAFVPVT